uniref:Uncharacterized protein n=1 Tax=Rhinopithecus roxellana TaxID=61622 RepID=A0A2K6RLC2_RHIRO
SPSHPRHTQGLLPESAKHIAFLSVDGTQSSIFLFPSGEKSKSLYVNMIDIHCGKKISVFLKKSKGKGKLVSPFQDGECTVYMNAYREKFTLKSILYLFFCNIRNRFLLRFSHLGIFRCKWRP